MVNYCIKFESISFHAGNDFPSILQTSKQRKQNFHAYTNTNWVSCSMWLFGTDFILAFAACHTNCNYKFIVWKCIYKYIQPDMRYLCILWEIHITSYGTQCTTHNQVQIWQISICLIIWISHPHHELHVLEKRRRKNTAIIHIKIRKWMHSRLNFWKKEMTVNGGEEIIGETSKILNSYHPFRQNDTHTMRNHMQFTLYPSTFV